MSLHLCVRVCMHECVDVWDYVALCVNVCLCVADGTNAYV